MRMTSLGCLIAHCAALCASLCALLIAPLAGPSVAQAAEGYYRFPALHADTLVFTAEGDLWKVPASGGLALRLTSHPAQETRAAVSPDGKTVAFTAEYEGPAEIYTMPLAGGLPVRRTWFGRTATCTGWTPDGKILCASSRYSTMPETQLIRIDPSNNEQSLIPLSQASDGAYEPDGGTLFFTRLPFQGSYTKRYQGGSVQSLWRYREGEEAVPLTADYPGTSTAPMFWQGRVYFISDRDGILNLYSMSPDGGDLRQHTKHLVWDVKSPSLSEGRIAYQLGADIHIYDIASGTDAVCPIRLASDFDQSREFWEKKPMDYLTAVHPSPDGDRIVLTARGQVFVAPAKAGRLVQVTRNRGLRYRGASFLAGGKALLAQSDETGEIEFIRLPADGIGPEKRITEGGKVFRFEGTPSPDGKSFVFQDKNQVLWLGDAESGKLTRIDDSPEGSFVDLEWSPDSRWIAYTKTAADQFSQIHLYALDTGRITSLTTDQYDSYNPAFSPDGKWIYFLSDRTLVSLTGGIWGPRQPEPFFDRSTRIYHIPLQKGLRSPFAPVNELHPEPEETDGSGGGSRGEGEEGGNKDKDKTEAKVRTGAKDKTGGEGGKKGAVKLTVDLDGIAARIQEVPLEAGNYSALSVNDKHLYFLSRETGRGGKRTLQALEIGREKKDPVDLVKDVSSYELTADGKKLMIRKEDAIHLAEAGGDKELDLAKTRVPLDAWTFPVDPRTERRQMFVEAWRLERDYFYDPAMHGVDWPGVLRKYLPLLDRVTDRPELSDLLGEMVGELSALHIFVTGGDFREGLDQVKPGLLGAALERDDAAGGYRVRHVYRTDPDRPSRVSPLARPGVDVADGDLIESINGVPLAGVPDPGALLRDQAGKQVRLRVKGTDGGRDVIVVPMAPLEERELRYDDWEYGRRQLVEEWGKGEIGYVHLRAMGASDYADWSRQYYPIFQRKGLIIDMRNNRGGNIDSWILEKLLRRVWMYWQPRVGNAFANMPFAFGGHMVTLIDEGTASDGEAFAEGFRRLGLGRVIGTRTWGGEIWLSMDNLLVDNGIASAAESGVFAPEGAWLIEGHGVDPDSVVDNPPHATFLGEDAQLRAAVSHLQELIRKRPVTTPPAPKYPVKALRTGPDQRGGPEQR